MGTRKTTIRTVKGRLTSATRLAEKPIEMPGGMRERISDKAYELWEQRGRQDGHALRDWLEAETIMMKEIHKARE